MASNVNNQEDESRQLKLDDLLKKWDGKDDDESEDVTSPDQSEGGVSMFCKACLNPYSGEPKAGTIVLKCERCGQTDVVLEEKAVDLDPQEWSGNLMMNRFLQVLKEQEDLKLNIVDPFFADDDYQHLLLAIQEYTFNMKAIAEKMYDIAYEAKMACELDEEDDSVSSARTQLKLKKLRATVTKLMFSIIRKHNLPPDVMERVQYRVRHPSFNDKGDGNEDGDANKEDDVNEGDDRNEADVKGVDEPSNTSNEGSVDNIGDIVDDACENDVDKSDVDIEVKPDNKSDSADTNAGLEADKEEEETEANEGKLQEVFKGNNSASMVIAKEKIQHEIFGVLKSKFKINFGPVEENKEKAEDQDDAKKNEASSTEDNTDEDNEITNKNDDKLNPDNHSESDAKGSVSVENASQNDTKDNAGEEDHSKSNTRDTAVGDDTLYKEVLKDIDGLASDETNQHDNEEDNNEVESDDLQVNFYSISRAFICELQSRKKKALIERKDKALRIVHEKIMALKQEVENVESRVHDELTSAYQKKLKKVENQRKQLDKRHETIQDVEKLMNHYAQTGQNDKLRELMEHLDIQYEN